ncbi:hypothetical protein A1F94_001313 [Pyrenophora tritici-repentis]|uniref:Uncharacterized protein n=1 Tax=Pyrenophora tritici-repentis TaxID=45151 RepID=A0A5M9LQL5_9PLEO|nr:hypothetical protein PtrV1_01932 [Pyrenophora tritici-repentis]KAF7454664.1 hypothetical protein A1F99_019220 [Pyrenophora tritici-repentis]KAF7577790.1 hypothetical protein PtrM4_020300 [Pyrenophora tritici-repentis]KAG9388421.1 hypothetical protein A1F94_001313 [Pyrenophora tritici-repentis]KAI0571164.1 hypothetical protein Alg130_10981 [Pyrenophora tritici-repentis]
MSRQMADETDFTPSPQAQFTPKAPPPPPPEAAIAQTRK